MKKIKLASFALVNFLAKTGRMAEICAFCAEICSHLNRDPQFVDPAQTA